MAFPNTASMVMTFLPAESPFQALPQSQSQSKDSRFRPQEDGITASASLQQILGQASSKPSRSLFVATAATLAALGLRSARKSRRCLARRQARGAWQRDVEEATKEDFWQGSGEDDEMDDYQDETRYNYEKTLHSSSSKGGRQDGPRYTQEMCLRGALTVLVTQQKVEPRKAERMARDLQRYAVALKGEDPKGFHTKNLARRLVRLLEMHPGMEAGLYAPGGAIKVLNQLDERSQKHNAQYVAIKKQHKDLQDGEDGDIDRYSEASAHMGKQWWARAMQERIAFLIDQYFLLTTDQVKQGHPQWAFEKKARPPPGWKRYNQKGKVYWWNPKLMKMQLEGPPGFVQGAEAAEAVPPARWPPLALLDIGSNSNVYLEYAHLVKPFAMDLRPSQDSEGIYEADFFEVPLIENKNPLRRLTEEEESRQDMSSIERFIVNDDGKLEGIVEGSFDVAVISLVLSYVPDAEKRIEMIAKARRCLRNDRGLLFVAEAGSLLPHPSSNSWYQGDAAAEWSRAMEGVGFKVKKFETEIGNEKRKKPHPILLWVLEAAPIPDEPTLTPLVVPKELPW
eukprot:TRINITY_DN9709_c0_g8_i1.p1 TRINITY_DN9709_c0_g8~~TRINITY_DN9709_c0_g8_i1.p1  ORF type:complete len:586 (+),score=113.27 TRINITY_DN9709_c0_g8_i1:63-1760(+)